jgi:hypothetical protein
VPDFTFALSETPTHAQMALVYAKIMGPGGKPTISLGSVSQADAVAWLKAQHLHYLETMNSTGGQSRSSVMTGMKIEDRVTLVDVTP